MSNEALRYGDMVEWDTARWMIIALKDNIGTYAAIWMGTEIGPWSYPVGTVASIGLRLQDSKSSVRAYRDGKLIHG